jgi:hypothetical protein
VSGNVVLTSLISMRKLSVAESQKKIRVDVCQKDDWKWAQGRCTILSAFTPSCLFPYLAGQSRTVYARRCM